MVRVVVDTSVLSLALRRRNSQHADVRLARTVVADLASRGDLILVPPVRQELLTGVRSRPEFVEMRNALRAFPDEPMSFRDYERAAEMSNIALSAGIRAAPTDLLICAVSEREAAGILATDRDFEHLQPILGIRLHPF